MLQNVTDELLSGADVATYVEFVRTYSLKPGSKCTLYGCYDVWNKGHYKIHPAECIVGEDCL